MTTSLPPEATPTAQSDLAISVSQACEEIWSCQNADQAVHWIQALHSAVLRERHLDAYDPSEAFFAVQGAALRFRAAANDTGEHLSEENEENDQQHEHVVDAVQTVREKTVWASAALARSCVGPAWWHQVSRRHVLHVNGATGQLDDSSSTLTPSSDGNHTPSGTPSRAPREVVVHHHGDGQYPQHAWSPMTQATNLRGTEPTSSRWYPIIPEVLPAAMLRFASTMLVIDPPPPSTLTTPVPVLEINTRSTATAQIILVLALSCPPSTANARRFKRRHGENGITAPPEWTIPGVQDAVGSMVLSWLRLATMDSIPSRNMGSMKEEYVSQFAFQVQVVRACTDLFRAIWRPRVGTCKDIIEFLLGIATRDIDERDTSLQKQETHVATVSIAAEALSALVVIGSRGLLPYDSLTATVQTLCRFYASERVRSPDFPLTSPDVSLEDQMENNRHHTLSIIQQEPGSIDIADMLWVLLAQSSTAEMTMETLLSIFDRSNLASTTCQLPHSGETWDDKAVMLSIEGAIAIYAASSALWGEPPDIESIPLLRTYWSRVLDTISQSLSFMYGYIVEQSQDNRDADSRVGYLNVLAVELVLASGRVVKREIRGSTGSLSPVECISLTTFLKIAVIPWLSENESLGGDPLLPITSDESRRCAMSSVCKAFIFLLCDFLEQCVRFESIPFGEYSIQKNLYLMLLQDVAPCLETSAATIVGCAVFRSWAKFGLFPHRVEGWSQTAASILGVAFSTNQSEDSTHSPAVRLVALRALTFDPDELIHSENNANEDGQVHSLLGLTQNVREQHLSFIESSIIPALRKVVWEDAGVELKDSSCLDTPEGEAVNEGSGETITARHLANVLSKSVEVMPGALDLQLFAIQLIGRLFRGVTGDRGHRLLFLEMLQSVALCEKRDTPGSRKRAHAIPVRVAAAVELERCLVAPFSRLPHAHECVPHIVEILCSILDEYSNYYLERTLSSLYFYQVSSLVVSALDPLTRLKVAIDSHIAFRIRGGLPTSVDDMLYSFFCAANEPDSRNRSLVAESRGATFLVVQRGHLQKKAPNKTVVSFERIAASLIALAGKLQAGHDKADPLASQLKASLKIVCFDALSSMALASVHIDLLESKTSDVFFTPPPHAASVEILARSRSLCQIAQTTIVEAWEQQMTQLSRAESWDPLTNASGIKPALSLILRLLGSRIEEEFISGCDVICSLLPSLIHSSRGRDQCLMEDVWHAVEDRVAVELERHRNSTVKALSIEQLRRSIALLTVIHDILLSGPISTQPNTLAFASFRLCLGIVTKTPESNRTFFIIHLALRCSTTLIDRMSLEEIQEGKTILANNSTHAMESDSVEVESTARFWPKVVAELFERRSSDLRRKCTTGAPRHFPVALSKHDILAVEADNIDRFQVERDTQAQIEPSSAWLCGHNTLLTCRLGSSTSRYRGWLELVMRSLSCRTRVLVRLPGRLALEDPEFPGLSEAPSMSIMNSDPVEKGTMSTNVVSDKARAVLSRFDALVLSERPSKIGETGANDTEPIIDCADHILNEIQYDLDTQSSGKDSTITGWLRSLFGEDNDAVSTSQDEIDALLSTCGIDCADETFAPQRLEGGRKVKRAITILDRIPVLNTHKVALLYDDRRKDIDMEEETRVLATMNCSPTFHNFVTRIGKVVPTRYLKTFSAGLDTSKYESDGKYAVVWMEEEISKSPAATTKVVFHIVSLMPQGVRNRKRHVGNDNVLILYSDKGNDEIVEFDLAGGDLSRSVLRGEFGFVTIYVTPSSLSPNVLRVALRVRNGLTQALQENLAHLGCNRIIIEEDAPMFIRNLAIRADLACRAAIDSIGPPSNCLERSRMLNEMYRYIIE